MSDDPKKAILDYLNSGNKPVTETKPKNIWGKLFGFLCMAAKGYLKYQEVRG